MIAPLERLVRGEGTDGERVVDTLADLAAIYDDAVDVVRLRRPFRDDVRHLAERPFVLSFRGAPETVDFDAAFPGDASAAARAVRTDLLEWTRVFGHLLEAREVGVRIVCGEQPMCPRFHVDHVTVRLVTAYVGEGTEWLGRSAWEHASTVDHAASRAQARDYHRAQRGDIVLLKGSAFSRTAAGVIHRSPSALGPRLLATVDVLTL